MSLAVVHIHVEVVCVLLLGVEVCLGLQLTGRLVNVEELHSGIVQNVGQRVATVGICSRDRRADVPTCRRVLGYASLTVLGVGERGSSLTLVTVTVTGYVVVLVPSAASTFTE